MADPMGHGTDTAVVSDAFVAARELLRGAEDEAARIRADVDRYVRQREQEAELLVNKARRLLAMAEERAASLATVDVAERDQVGEQVEAALARRPEAAPATSPVEPTPEPTGLDGVLASAINKALDRSFPRLR